MRRASDGQEGAQSPPEVTAEIPFDVLGFHRKPRAFCAEFGIVQKSSALGARITKVPFASRVFFRPARQESIWHVLHTVTMSHDIFLIFEALFVLKRLGYVLPVMVLE